MTEKTDKDREILQAILRALDQVSEEGRERILRTVSTFYDLDLSNGPRRMLSEPRPPVQIAANDRKVAFTERATLSPKAFLQEKQPQTAVERVVCLAYYLSHYRDTPRFKTIDISKLNTEAAQLKFSNPAYAVSNAGASGLLVSAEKGTKQISAIGERFVDALPDREKGKAVLASMRLPRRRKKSSRTRKARKDTK
jgi:hypothetical protein